MRCRGVARREAWPAWHSRLIGIGLGIEFGDLVSWPIAKSVVRLCWFQKSKQFVDHFAQRFLAAIVVSKILKSFLEKSKHWRTFFRSFGIHQSELCEFTFSLFIQFDSKTPNTVRLAMCMCEMTKRFVFQLSHARFIGWLLQMIAFCAELSVHAACTIHNFITIFFAFWINHTSTGNDEHSNWSSDGRSAAWNLDDRSANSSVEAHLSRPNVFASADSVLKKTHAVSSINKINNE